MHMCVKCEETVNCWLGEVDKRERRAMKKELAYIRSVARNETLDVHQKNWVCHIYCQINAQIKINK